MTLSEQVRGLVDVLRGRLPSPPLTPRGVWSEDVETRLRALSDGDLFERPVADGLFARAVRSGLYLWNDSLSASHTLAMSESAPASLAKTTLDYWHAIMHRREPDYPNAKYWFRRVGTHPIYADVLHAAQGEIASRGLASSSPVRQAVEAWEKWDAFAFVDLCERHSASDSAEEEALRAIQAREIERLLSFSVEHATEGER